jgi:aspartate/methionine/tyrosine aminotransferase
MMTADALGSLMRAAAGEGISFISDEIYHGLDFAFTAQTALAFLNDAVVINSFSKYFCMTGWRVGWMVVPDVLLRPIERLQQNLAISVPTLSQIAAEAAFDGAAEMQAVKRGYEASRSLLAERLPRAGLASFPPMDGAFYLYADVSGFCDDSFAFASRLLQETGVAVTPGADFDRVNGRRFIRLCYPGTGADIAEAVDRIGDWLNRV